MSATEKLFVRSIPWRHLVGALVAGTLLRAFMLYLVAYRFDVGDANSYDQLAVNLIDHGVYGYEEAPPIVPTVLRPPGYSMFLAAVFQLFGHSYVAVQILQIIISLATCVLVAVTAARIVREHTALPTALPVVALWAGALSPFDSVYCGALLSEVVCTALLVAGICIPLLSASPWRWLAAGVAFGAAALVRDVFLLFVPFALVVWVIAHPRPRSGRELARSAATLLLGTVLAVAPWTARNYAHTGKLIPISEGSLGTALWMGGWSTNGAFTASDATGTRQYPDEAYLSADERELVDRGWATTDGRERHRIFMDLFWRRVRAEPHLVLGRWLIRLPRLWLGTRFDIFAFTPTALAYGSVPWTILKVCLLALDAVLVGLGLVGLVVVIRRRILPLIWLATPTLYLTLLFLPLNSFETRYSHPALPLLIVLASLAALLAYARVARRARGKGTGPSWGHDATGEAVADRSS